MRELSVNEIRCVSGGTGACTVEDANNVLAGINNPERIGDDLINIYEGVVQAASHVIERVASAL